jgi:phosphatidate phosphatase PAH1
MLGNAKQKKILPAIGKDWAQSGVAQLYTKIRDNRYRIMYLSAEILKGRILGSRILDIF